MLLLAQLAASVAMLVLAPYVTYLIISPRLRLDVRPPGYPVSGRSWSIETWGSLGGQPWVPVVGTTIEINCSATGIFVIQSDDYGKASFTYDNRFGEVVITANHSLYGSARFMPQTEYIDRQTALLVFGYFCVSPPLALVALRKMKRQESSKFLAGFLLGVLLIGFVLSLAWFMEWEGRSEWGYGNVIVHWPFLVMFRPHLLGLYELTLAIVLMISVRAALEK